jgi:FMN phosphatase YigB (HAD superfamily)
VTGYPPSEIAYVGDRLDNDITPAAQAGLFTVWLRRGPWAYVLRPGDPSPTAAPLPDGAPSLTISTLDELVARLATDRL